MTSKLTRERLEKIKSWRETYGAGNNVMLPAEEAEELARMALAAMNNEPFAYIIQDKYERERGVDGHLSRSHVSKYVSQEDINEHEITCTPLYRHAQQPVVPVSQKEPISFDDWSRKCALQVTLCYSDFREKAQYIWDSARETMHVEPSVPVLTRADFENWCKKRFALSLSYFEKDASGVYTGTLVHDMYIAWESCRAAMLNGGKS
ncbi:hypothetical protein [Klebsiella pneumoniae]|uniref:hypothetical protein n=1 Tax=Klebsiella pneumoniae TaxID=573 RepID=UPI00209EFC66|nr:hypothetical protein [Klebsiella pneumoniae]HDU5960956.1 hypothetical protein [Klebsiella pneumoniae]HEK7475383.1 hypothetical protein [Klebsiella pneumoniae]HEK7961045.1 hypothetical protein [Klebsiella pneumoniae]HEK7986847.1 hypothetical protein [Klebsiella pneumoniae]